MNTNAHLQTHQQAQPATWLVTGAAGFIGMHTSLRLLARGDRVIGLDNHLFGLPTTGLRFFTVYGPWGLPDMALFLFTKAILAGQPIDIFNHGDMVRDFTFVDDIVDGRNLYQPHKLHAEGWDYLSVGRSATSSLSLQGKF